MTLTEAKQYESQGWPHEHDWSLSHEIIGYKIFKCRCGKHMIKIGLIEHIIE